MKLEYFADTDSLSITFRDHPSVDSKELSAGVVIDYDADGRVVGIDIDNASHKVDLTHVVLNRLPGTVEQEATQPAALLLPRLGRLQRSGLGQLPPGSAARHRAGLRCIRRATARPSESQNDGFHLNIGPIRQTKTDSSGSGSQA